MYFVEDAGLRFNEHVPGGSARTWGAKMQITYEDGPRNVSGNCWGLNGLARTISAMRYTSDHVLGSRAGSGSQDTL